MKKALSILILLTVTMGCCSSKKTAQASTDRKGQGLQFEYTALTRGSYKKVIATAEGLKVTNGRDAEPQNVAISTADWNNMVDFYQKNIEKKLSGLQDLEAPSKKHQYDGALAATFTVMIGDQLFRTPTFDHGNPPAQVKGLVDEMIRLAGMETNK
ncbi:hypothetical protein ACLI09_00210 [Flavobacterium sp. RHBU_24]|uniref:hypothetical protein n=1 Tax=Flavobacterium sp. RHBU_24 TaxID=3391185 RepID=UPI0039849960